MDEHINAHYDIIIIMIWKAHSTIGFSAKTANQKGILPALYGIIDVMASSIVLHLARCILATYTRDDDDHHHLYNIIMVEHSQIGNGIN